jgi:hypothetical protein
MEQSEIKTFRKALALLGAIEIKTRDHQVSGVFGGYTIDISRDYRTKKFNARLHIDSNRYKFNDIGFSLKSPDKIAADIEKRLIDRDSIKKAEEEAEQNRDKERLFNLRLTNLVNKYKLRQYNQRIYFNDLVPNFSKLELPYQNTERFRIELDFTSFDDLEKGLSLVFGGLNVNQ